jgi:tRNA(adenine34) deaminase
VTEATGETYMRMALELAREAEAAGEVPVGAVIVVSGQVVGRGRNSPIERSDPTAHAEILALRDACSAVGNYRLKGAILYTTLEPCVMCAGALVTARVTKVVFGTRDLRFGGVRSKFRLADADVLNHRLIIEEGLLGAECAELMLKFFAGRRVFGTGG